MNATKIQEMFDFLSTKQRPLHQKLVYHVVVENAFDNEWETWHNETTR